MPFASHNEIVAAGGHSVPTLLKMRLALQETSGSVAHNSAIAVDEPIVGYTPTAGVGPNAVLPNALVAGAAPNTVNLATMVSLGNRTLLGWVYLPAIEGTEACWIINGQYTNGRAGISSTRQLIAKRGGTITAVTSLAPLGEWVQLSFRHNGTRWRFGVNGVYEDVTGVWSDSTNLLGLATNDLNDKAARFAHWSAYSDEITDAEERLYFRGPEPIRSAHPVMSQDDSTWWASTGTYGLPSPLAADANGEFTYEWELRLASDDSVVQSGTGTPGGAKPAAGTYYVWLRVSNNAGYDALQDGESSDVALTAAEITSIVVGTDGDTVTVTGSGTLANYSGFTFSGGITLTPVSGTGSTALVYTASETIDKDAELTAAYAAGDVTIGGSPLGEFTGYTVDNQSAQDIAAPLITGATFASGNLTVVSNEVMSGYDGFVLTSDLGVAIPLTYVSGDDSNTRVFSAGREVGGWEVLKLAYTAGDVVDEGANALADFSEFSVTNNSSVTEMWLPSVLDISGELLLMEFVNSSGAVPLNIGDGATGNLSVDFGSGAFNVSPEHVGLIRNSNRIAVIIPETERLSSIPSCTISASAGWIKRSGGTDIAAVSQTLWASNILAESIPSVTPRKQTEFGVNFGRVGYYQSNLVWTNLARCFDGGWQYVSDPNIKASLTNLGLPTDAVATEIWGLLSGGTIPWDSVYIMWEGDTSIEFSVSTGPTTEDLDTTAGGKRWKKYSWPGAHDDRLKITCTGDCSSITNFVVCRDTDWDDTAKDVATVLVPEALERYAGVTYLRFLEHQDINRFSSPDVDHITHADYQAARGQKELESATISNIEDYTTNTAYYVTDGDYFGLGGSYGGDGSSVIKVTHDGSVAFRTGDPIALDVDGTIDGDPFSIWKVANHAAYVPDGVTTYFYLYAQGLDASAIVFNSGEATIERRYGAPPEMLAEVCNYLYENASLTHIWVMCGHHESAARQAAYAARLNAALNSGIKIYCELSNEWTFNFAVPFSFAYYYFRRIHNVSGVSGMDDEWDAGAYYLSQFYDTLVAEFGESRVEPVVVGQTFTSQAYTGILDSALLTAPVAAISGNNYFIINRADMQLGVEEADSISPSGMCTLASETINALQFGAWGSLSDFAQGRSLEVLNYEGGNHSTVYLDHPIEYTTGWTLASGNRYTQSEFRYITSVKNGSTTLTKAVDAAACGTTDNSFFWDSSGEVLHVNLAGTDPDTVTLSAMRYDRFSMAERYHVNHPRFARVFNRMFDILDTLGISANQYNMANRQGNDGSLEAFVWGAYTFYDQPAGDGISDPDNAALTEQVYRGDIDKSVYYPQIDSIRGYEINRWTDPENFLPVATLVVIDSAGTEVTVTFSKAVESGADGWSGLVVGGEACTYSSGTGTDTIVFTCSAISSGTQTAAYTQPGDGIQDADGGLLATFSGMATTNNVASGNSAPTVTTATESDVTYTTATLGGNVTADGGATVTSRGVYWSTSSGPTASDNVETAGAGGTGAFTVAVTGLPVGTTIYVKAWATNGEGTSTGSEVSFSTTAATTPTVTTATPTSETSSGATVGGNVTDGGGATVTSRGVYWSLTTGPTSGDNVETAASGGTGEFTVSISGVDPETTVYVKAFATNSEGTVTGDEETFTTLAESVEANSYNELWGLGSYAKDASAETEHRLQETSGTSFADSSGNGRTGTMGSSFTAVTGPTGYLPSAMDFDKSFYINIPSISETWSGGTLVAWIKPRSGMSNFASPLAIRGKLTLHISSTNQFRYSWSDSATQYNVNMGSVTYDAWVRIALSVSSSEAVLYLNGVESATNTLAHTPQDITGLTVRIGDDNGSRKFDGPIAHASLFSRGWTASEAAQDAAGPEPLNSTAGSIQVQGGGDPEIGSTLEVNTAAGYNNPVSGANGAITITYRWFVNDVYQSTGATFDTTGLSVDDVVKFQSRGTNLGDYDAAEDTDSSNSITMVAAGPSTPTVTTAMEEDVTYTTATLGGNVTADGGATVTSRGVYWATTSNPTSGDNVETAGAGGTGAFTVAVTGLPAGTTIYFRAWATNSEGTDTGDVVSFSTNTIVAPTVTTATPTSETSSGATVGGNVTADGGATVTSRGVYWALTSNPTSGDNVETAGAGGTGSYTVSITGVDPETTVYVVAWATNSAGTATGSEVEFTTLAASEGGGSDAGLKRALAQPLARALGGSLAR